MFAVRAVLAATFVIATTLPALAAPTDCSTTNIPGTPVKGMVNGKPFIPNEVSMTITKNGMQVNEFKFDRWELHIQTDGIFNAATVQFLVKAGTKPDGKTFRVLPTDSISDQPAAAPGTPEVQGWDLELEDAGVDTSFTQDIASIRLELGKSTATVIPGRVAFCVPGAKATITGAFIATFAR